MRGVPAILRLQSPITTATIFSRALQRSVRMAAPKSGVIREGLAEVLTSEERSVFYNNVQVQNRDLSVLAIKAFAARRKAGALPLRDSLSGPSNAATRT